jgi:hypothetical protein
MSETKLPFNFDFNEVIKDMIIDHAERAGVRADTLIMSWIVDRLFSTEAKPRNALCGAKSTEPPAAAHSEFDRVVDAKAKPRVNGKFVSSNPKTTKKPRQKRGQTAAVKKRKKAESVSET